MKKTLLLLASLATLLLTLTIHDTVPTAYDPPLWEAFCTDATATIYHAVPAQCNADVTHTASMFKIDTARAGSYRILAMERTMMARYGISYGDTVRIEGTGAMDGLWRVEDTMNRRFAGQHRIDLLVDRNVTAGKWDNVRIYRRTVIGPHVRRATI